MCLTQYDYYNHDINELAPILIGLIRLLPKFVLFTIVYKMSHLHFDMKLCVDEKIN